MGRESADSGRAAIFGRPLFFLLAALVVAGGAAAFLLARHSSRPDVVLITIDTLRPDAVGEGTPALDRLIARGIDFPGARTPAPLTLPAHTSILTGLLPAHHGLRDNASPPLPPRRVRRFPTLAEQFERAGYATAAFVASNVLDPRFRLDAGFQRYDHPPPPVRGAITFASLPAEEQVSRFRDFLQTRSKGRPFFAWIHLWEPHWPYEPYAGDAERKGTASTDSDRERYLGEVRRADAAVEKILASVDPEKTIVVVCSDHGESLGAHGERTHAELCHSSTMHVLLVVAGPGLRRGKHDPRVCSLVDIAPTLRALCGLDETRTDGHDLLAPPPPGRVVCGESLYCYRRYGWAQQSVATDGAYTLLECGPRLELFDARKDPGELKPLADPLHQAAYERLDRALGAYRSMRPLDVPRGPEAPETPYGSVVKPRSSFLPPSANRRLPDVEKHLPELKAIFALRVATAEGDKRRVEAALPAVVALGRSDPGNPAPGLARGRALLQVLDRPAEAAAALAEAWDRGYKTMALLKLRLWALARAGDRAGFTAALESARGAVPEKERAELAAHFPGK